MEESRINVDKEMVCALNRQASAFEALVGQIKRFADIFEKSNERHPELYKVWIFFIASNLFTFIVYIHEQ